LLKVNGKTFKVKKDKAKIKVAVGNVKVIYKGNKYTKKTSKSIKAY